MESSNLISCNQIYGFVKLVNRFFVDDRLLRRYRRQRIGEGAIGLLLWKWLQLKCDEVYVTVFDKHTTLILQFERFGFQKCGVNLNGENVLIKSREKIDFSDPYKAFPFIKYNFDYAGYIIIDDYYHDTMFACSELAKMESLQSERLVVVSVMDLVKYMWGRLRK